MPYKLKIVALIILCLTISPAQNLLWTKIYGQQGVLEEGEVVRKTLDNNYIVGEHSMLLKIDGNGDTLWTRGYSNINSIVPTPDSGFIICGFGGGDVQLRKTDKFGNLVWTRSYGGPGQDWGRWVEHTSDNGYIITGSIQSGGSGIYYNDVYLIKTDANGDTIWTRRFGSPYPYQDEGYSVLQTTDGGYLLTGYTQDTLSQEYRIIAIMTDAGGNTIWTKTYSFEGFGCDVKQTQDGNYIIAARAVYPSPPQYAGLLIKINPSGTIIWSKWYLMGETGTFLPKGISLALTPDGGYFITFGKEKCWFIRTDSLGNTIWSLNWGSSTINASMSVCRAESNTYIIVGRTDSLDISLYGNLGIWKVGDNVGIEEFSAPSLEHPLRLTISPNPFREKTMIYYILDTMDSEVKTIRSQNPEVSIKIYDAGGELVKSFNLVSGSQNRVSSIIWNGTGDSGHPLPAGVYFVHLKAGEYQRVEKLILLK